MQEKRYIGRPGFILPISSEECVLHARAGFASKPARREVMTHDVFHAIRLCNEFRTLAQHRAAVAQGMPHLGQHPQAIDQVLSHLVGQDLLCSEDDYLASLTSAETHANSGTTPSLPLAIRTCDRPESLAALLEALRSPDAAGGAQEIVVFDDSRLDDKLHTNRAIAERHNARYVGPQEQSEFLKQLAQAMPKDEGAELALDQLSPKQSSAFTGGRLQNLILLHFAGRRFAQLDDDLLPQVLVPPGGDQDRNVVLNARCERQYRFGAEGEHGWANSESSSIANWLEALDTFCGASLPTLDKAQPLRTGDMSVDLLAGLGESSFVPHVCSGFYGTGATTSTLWTYRLAPAALAGMVVDRDTYYAQREASQIAMCPSRAQLTRAAAMTPAATDARRMMPPTIAIGRNEDLVHHAATRLAYPSSLAAHVPMMLKHERAQEHRADVSKDLYTPGFADYLTGLLDLFANNDEGGDPVSRLQSAATQMIAHAQQSDEQLRARVGEFIAVERAAYIQDVQRNIEQFDTAPPYWKADARLIVKNHAKALLHSEEEQPNDVLRSYGRADDDQWLDALRIGLNEYAELCQSWSHLWRAALACNDAS